MSKSQRDKGNRVEREIVNDLNADGIPAKRVPLSGMCAGFKGDIHLWPGEEQIVAEVKARKNGEGFTVIERWLGDGDNDLLFLKRNNRKPLVVMEYATFVGLVKGVKNANGNDKP